MRIVTNTLAAFWKALSRPVESDANDNMNEAQQLIASFGRGDHDYKAPHAPRGTTERKHLITNRKARKHAARKRAAVGYDQPQPIKHMHSAARRRLNEMKESA